MKLFQNPIVVGVLALVAAVLVFRSAIQPMLKRNAPARREAVAAPVPPLAAEASQKKPQPQLPASPANETPANAPEPDRPPGIDLDRVGWAFHGSPPRDPFQLMGSISPPARLLPPASEVLALTAIWRQTGESLAVINGRILGKGEEIEGYQIDSMENGRVWVTGPAGRESLEFSSGAPAQTNASPGTAAATTPGPKSGG